MQKVLIANRGEIAVRIARTAGDLGVKTVAVYADDDAASLHTRAADQAVSLGASGVPAYLDGTAVIAAAQATGCDAVHPGYGFLSENAAFAAACEQAGLTFVGPTPQTLALFGDKAAARALAQRCGVPLLAGTSAAVTMEEARDFLAGLGPGGAVMLKAVAGGGGRGMRPGNMVGPVAEKTALVRHCARMYVAGANLTVPYFNVVLRKAYGLGAIAMAAASFDETFFSISWPTGEFAGMGLEGQVKLGRRAELQAITDIPARRARYDALVADSYAWARALNAGTVFEVDDVIDPADTRKWLVMGLNSVPPTPVRAGKKRPWIDTW